MSDADRYIFGLLCEAAARRDTIPWTFYVVTRELGPPASNEGTAIRLMIAREGAGAPGRPGRRAGGPAVPDPRRYAARERRELSWGEALAPVLDGLRPADRRQLADAAPALRLLADRLSGDPASGADPGH